MEPVVSNEKTMSAVEGSLGALGLAGFANGCAAVPACFGSNPLVRWSWRTKTSSCTHWPGPARSDLRTEAVR